MPRPPARRLARGIKFKSLNTNHTMSKVIQLKEEDSTVEYLTTRIEGEKIIICVKASLENLTGMIFHAAKQHPSMLIATIAATSDLLRDTGDEETADYLKEIALDLNNDLIPKQ